MNQLNHILETLEFLKKDPIIIKRVKEKANEIILLLQQKSELQLDKALRELEELDSSDIPSYDRTQLWDIISQLERLNVSAKP